MELFKKKFLKFHNVSKDNFIYYLKELEFRYNFRDNIYDSLYICLGRLNLGITKIENLELGSRLRKHSFSLKLLIDSLE